MKPLVTPFLLSLSIFLMLGCSNDSDPKSTQQEIEQSEIKQKIAEYYSAPSSTTQSVVNIQDAFKQKFPNATDIEWKVSNKVYEIDFEINGVDHEAWYDSDANLLMYKYDIANNELPSAVSSAIANDYPGYILDDAEKVFKGNITGYYVDLKKNKKEIHAFYNEDGTFISKNLWESDSVKPENGNDATNPVINGNMSDDEVDNLIAAYYSGYDVDVLPSNVPDAIRRSFTAAFPNAREVDWETSANVYKVDFEINNVDYDAWYHQNGALLAYKFDITRASLPQSVKATISSQFNGYAVDDAEKVVKPKSIGYLVELEKGNIEEDAYLHADGTYISKSFYQKKNTSGNNIEEPEIPEIPIDGNYTDVAIDDLLSGYYKGRETDIKAANVPALITAKFKNQFALARDIEWEYVNNVYNVEFEINNVDHEAWYVTDGTLLMFMQEVKYRTVPSVVQNAVSSKYSGYFIDGADYFQKGTVKGYIIELENKRTDVELIVVYKEDGTFIHQQYD